MDGYYLANIQFVVKVFVDSLFKGAKRWYIYNGSLFHNFTTEYTKKCFLLSNL